MARKPTSIADTFRAQFEGIGGPDAELPEDSIDVEVPLEDDILLDGEIVPAGELSLPISSCTAQVNYILILKPI